MRDTMSAALKRLVDEDAVGQLLRREGEMARLGTEHGALMLDWVDAVGAMVGDPTRLGTVEEEARALLARGVRHIIWAGMGGSVLTVQVLRALGFCAGAGVTIYPLDSTDPAALNEVVGQLASAKGVALTTEALGDAPALCQALLGDTLMVGVAMGMTSEEPISHLDWYIGLLRRGGFAPEGHTLVMALPGSYLERYADGLHIPKLALQLDGGSGTSGRMSAPSTRVFLLPMALELASGGAAAGTLRATLARAWAAYDAEGARRTPMAHRYVRLAAALSEASVAGACHLLFAAPGELDALRWWSEQLMEESLGKGGKGVIIFDDQPVVGAGSLRMRIAPTPSDLGAEDATAEDATGVFEIVEPLLWATERTERLAGVAATFMGLQLCVALYGYLHGIPFVGQPAVEEYKRRARELRAGGDPLGSVEVREEWIVEGGLTTLVAGVGRGATVAATLAQALRWEMTYVDLTINGELPAHWLAALDARLRRLGNARLGVAVKLRRAPAAYHSTEQSEMDGPAGVVSVRALAGRSAQTLLGDYDATFLRAQALGTWQAMREQGRVCLLVIVDGDADALGQALCELFDTVTPLVGGAEGA